MNEEEGSEDIILKYDPFILKLIYSKVYYLDHLLTIYLKFLSPSSLSITKPLTQREEDMKLMEFLIEKEYHIQCIKNDIDQLDRLLNDEKNVKGLGRFKFDLFYCNFEFCLYRLWIISNCHSQSSSSSATDEKKNILRDFDDSQFNCEMIISQNVNNKEKMNDNDLKLYNSFIERYIKDFYFNPLGFNAKRVRSRVKLFLITKETVEKALFKKYHPNSASFDTDSSFMIHHTKESIMSIMLIYFIDEFIHYMRHDTRYSLISKSDSKSYDIYDVHLGTSSTTNKIEDDRMSLFLHQLKGEILDACLSRLYTLADSSPNESSSSSSITSSSSSSQNTSFWSFFGKKEESSITQYQSLSLNDDEINDISNLLHDYEDEFEKESFYYSYQKKIVPKSSSLSSSTSSKKPLITKKDENAYKDFIQVKEKNGSKHYIDFIGLNDTYYDNIMRVFLFDIRLAKNHHCKKELSGKNINYTHPPSKTLNQSSSSSLSRPIFHCSICRYEFTHTDYQEFYHNMNHLSYNKKFSYSVSNVSKTNIFRIDLSKRLFRTSFDMVQSTEGFIYKTLYLSYLIPYHTNIISKEYMKNLSITKHHSSIMSMLYSNVDIPNQSTSSSSSNDPYTVLSHYENFLSFINIDNCIRSIQESIIHNTESRIKSIMKEGQRMSKLTTTSFDSIVIGASLLIESSPFSSKDEDEDPLTVNEITLRLATEILFLLLFIQAVSNEQLKNERRERSNNVSSRELNSVKTNNDIISCLNTIYCYYMLILSSKMKK